MLRHPLVIFVKLLRLEAGQLGTLANQTCPRPSV